MSKKASETDITDVPEGHLSANAPPPDQGDASESTETDPKKAPPKSEPGSPPKQNMDLLLVIEIVRQEVRVPKALDATFVNHANRQMVVDLYSLAIKLPPGWKGLQV